LTNPLTSFAKNHRKNQTEAEMALWRRLRSKGMPGLKFRRQQPIGVYIVDFVCLEKKLIIEVDGGQHANSEEDRRRDAWLQGEGYSVLRFWNNEVLGNLDGVMEIIWRRCGAPSPQQGRGSEGHRHPSPGGEVKGTGIPRPGGGEGRVRGGLREC
jgi:very-short-patch-repair endonuclease